MSDWFWKLMLRVNARAVFLLSLLVLCVVLVAMIQRGTRQADGLTIVGHHVTGAADPISPAVAHQSVSVSDAKLENPFTSAFLVAWLDLQASRQRDAADRERAAAVKPQPEKAAPQPKKAAPRQPPPSQWMRVLYQGLVVRPDGVTVAFVREQDGGKLHTVKVGDALLAMRVKAMTAGQLTLVNAASGDEQILQVGVVDRVRKDAS